MKCLVLSLSLFTAGFLLSFIPDIGALLEHILMTAAWLMAFIIACKSVANSERIVIVVTLQETEND